MPEVVGDAIDRICAMELRFKPGKDALPRGTMSRLYEAARSAAGKPLSYLAAKGLCDNVGSGDHVFILCGSGSPPFLPFGETDGPLGGAALARALEMGLGAKPVVISEDHMMPPNEAALRAAGLALESPETFAIRPHSALCVPFKYGIKTRDEVDRLFDQFAPKAVVFVERTGPNAKGVYHSVRGTPKVEAEILPSRLFADSAREKGIFTIGIGDGGNEIGFGNIYETAREILPTGKNCLCGCADGVITVVETDVLVSAGTSNWGAYGIAAMLGFLIEDPSLIQDTDTEYRMLSACVDAGGADGAYAAPIMKVDGTSWQVQQAIVTILREAVTNALTPLSRPF